MVATRVFLHGPAARRPVLQVLLVLPLLATLAACSDDSSPAAAGHGAGDGGSACASVGAAGSPCDDGDVCTANDKCVAGACVGTLTTCDDGLGCTVDGCAPATGCIHKVVGQKCAIAGQCFEAGAHAALQPCQLCAPGVTATDWAGDTGVTCDDKDPCTTADVCAAGGACTGQPLSCDDDNPCTADSCEAGKGCGHIDQAGPCEDDEPCKTGDECTAGTCKPGKTATACDDGDPCTKDVCASGKGCTSEPDATACDDGKPCTDDLCDAKKGCSHEAMAVGAVCNNGDPCVLSEICSPKLDCSGGIAKNCNDNSPCTTDSCKAGKGCVNAINKLQCTDGEPCTFPDLCTGGQCIGVKTGSCPTCQKIFVAPAAKLTTFQIGASGNPGQGINVDGDPATCAPSSNCSGGIDNAASVLAFLVNTPLISAVNTGAFSFVAELEGFTGPGQPFTLNLYQTSLAPGSKTGTPCNSEIEDCKCKIQIEPCNWLVSQAAMGPTCKAKFSFKNAVLDKGKLTAGGADNLFAMEAEILGAKDTTLYVTGATIVADVTLAPDGKTVQVMNGVLGGAVPLQAVLDVMNGLDDSMYQQMGKTKKEALELIQMLLELDIDSDGDGGGDAASIGLRFTGISAKIVGFQEK